MRLIDADAFEADMNENLLPMLIERYGRDEALRGLHFSFRDCICNIQAQPTIEPEPQWIPCSEAVPATEDKVLCQTITKKGVVNFVIGYHTENFGWACGMNSNVQAWMPLPEPYKEDTDE